jgi:hypothetical protein
MQLFLQLSQNKITMGESLAKNVATFAMNKSKG